MTGPFHTYGQSCLLTEDEPEPTSLYSLSAPPEIRSQFFYVSSLPIDDPLAPLPAASGQAWGNERAPPQPFSARDNMALETAWSDLREAQRRKSGSSGSRPETSKGRAGIAVPGHESAFEADRRQRSTARGASSLGSSRDTPSNSAFIPEEVAGPSGSNASHRKRMFSSSLNESSTAKRRSLSPPGEDGEKQEIASSPHAPPSRDASISGSPFIRAPDSQPGTPLGRSFESLASKYGAEWQAELRTNATHHSSSKPSGLRATVSLEDTSVNDIAETAGLEESQTMIPVGALRLHLVELPNLKV